MIIPVRVDPSIQPHVVRRGDRLQPEHPLAQTLCPVCDEWLYPGSVSLVFVGRQPIDRGGWTAMAVAVHDDCAGVEPSDGGAS